mgnify:CR=1 FL=1
MSNHLLTIDMNSVDAPKHFVKSLSSTGFAVIYNHGLDIDLIEKTYSDWRKFFTMKNKNNYLFDYEKQDGYFPFKSENALGSESKDLKEFFHIYSWGRYPDEISAHTKSMRYQLLNLGSELLDWLDDYAPHRVRKNFSMKLSEMIKDSGQNLLRIIHYPPVKDKDSDKGAIRAEAHTDINLITILIAEPGLQVLSQDKKWIDVKLKKNSIVVNIGDMLQECSKGFYKSTVHRVVNPIASKNISRYSMPLFIHPRNEVILSDKLTAEDYLNARLKEIGLK